MYYDADNVLHGRVLLYGNKIPESSFRNAASRYILNYPVTKDGELIGVTWLEAQQPVKDEDNSSGDNNNDNNNTTNTGKVVQLDDGNWYYVVNGFVDYSYNGVANNEYGWFYIRNGVLDWSYTGLTDSEYGWFYINNGVLDWNYTGLAYNEYGWFYVRNGALDWGYTGLANNEYGWFYVKNGVLDWSYMGVAGNEYGWFYVKNGVLDWSYTGVAGNEYGWFYIKNGVLDWSYTGVAGNEYGWFYIKNGALDWSYTGLAYNAYGTWYIVNGTVAFDYTGSVNNVNVVNGQVVGHEHNWVHREDIYGEKFVSKDNMKRYDDGTYIIDDGYEAVYESHIICGNCKIDFGKEEDGAEEAWVEHVLESPLYTGCQNYFVEEILVGEKCTAVVTPAHDECADCGVIKGE